MKSKIKKGDKVVVISGNHKGMEGTILAIDKAKNRVFVQGVNMVSKHIKAGRNPEMQQGGIVKLEGSIHISNLMLLHKGKATKIGYKLTEEIVDGKKRIKKQRVAKSTGELID